MVEMPLKQPELVGRAKELDMLRSALDGALSGRGSTVLVAGEAGIGKTRIVSELIREAEAMELKVIRGWCLAESLEPLMPVSAALDEAGLRHLVSGNPPPMVVSAYLINSAGMLIAKAEREKLCLDPDIFAGMLQAVGNFIKDSLDMISGEATGGGLNSLGYAEYNVLVRSMGKLSLAVVIKGESSELLIEDMKSALASFGDTFDSWMGNMAVADTAIPKMSWFLDSGKYEGRFLEDEARLKQENIFENVMLGLRRAAEERAVVLFLDDLQWADNTTLHLLHFLSRNVRENRVLLLGTYRPEDALQASDGKAHQLETIMQNMSREGLFSRVELNRLGREDTDRMTRSTLGNVAFDGGFMERIHRETEGNPFFVLETLKLLVEEGAVVSQDGGWVAGADRLDIPTKVYDVVKRRLNRLDREQREMLECASVIGAAFRTEILEAVTGQRRLALLRSLNEMENTHRLIHSVKDRFTFDHAKIRDVLYNGMGQALRVEYHRLIAEALEGAGGDGPEIAGELAHHYYEAGDARAEAWLVRAADRALELYANSEAISQYTMALELAERDGRTGQALELRNCIASVHLDAGNVKEAGSMFGDVLARAEKAGESEAAASARRGLGKVCWRTGDFDRAIEHGQAAAEYYAGKDDRQNLAVLYKDLGDVYGEKGEHDMGLDFYKKSIAMFDPNRDIYKIANVNMNIGVIYSLKKDWEQAALYYEVCIRDAESAGYLNTMAWALFNAAEAYTKMKHLDRAEDALKLSAEFLEKTDDRMGMAGVNMKFGELYLERGMCREAIPHLESCITTLGELGIPKYLADATHELGVALAKLGRDAEAMERFREALELYEGLGMDRNVETVKADMERLQ